MTGLRVMPWKTVGSSNNCLQRRSFRVIDDLFPERH